MSIRRDRKHLAFVRSLVCCVCLKTDTIEACHIRKGLPNHLKGGIGLKPPDCVTIPMCHYHHSFNHSKGDISFWGDMQLPINLAAYLWEIRFDRDKAIKAILRFNRVLRSQK